MLWAILVELVKCKVHLGSTKIQLQMFLHRTALWVPCFLSVLSSLWEIREKRVDIMMQMRVFHARLVVSVWCMFSLPKPLWRITMEEKKPIVDGLAAWMEGRIKTWRGLGRGWTEMLAGFEIKENNTQCQWKFSPTNFKSSASLNLLLITCIFGQICESLVNQIRLRTL